MKGARTRLATSGALVAGALVAGALVLTGCANATGLDAAGAQAKLVKAGLCTGTPRQQAEQETGVRGQKVPVTWTVCQNSNDVGIALAAPATQAGADVLREGMERSVGNTHGDKVWVLWGNGWFLSARDEKAAAKAEKVFGAKLTPYSPPE